MFSFITNFLKRNLPLGLSAELTGAYLICDRLRSTVAEQSIEIEGLRVQHLHADRAYGDILHLMGRRQVLDQQIRQKLEELWKSRGDA